MHRRGIPELMLKSQSNSMMGEHMGPYSDAEDGEVFLYSRLYIVQDFIACRYSHMYFRSWAGSGERAVFCSSNDLLPGDSAVLLSSSNLPVLRRAYEFTLIGGVIKFSNVLQRTSSIIRMAD